MYTVTDYALWIEQNTLQIWRGEGNQVELGIWLDQLHNVKWDQVDKDSFCGIFLRFMNDKMWHSMFSLQLICLWSR